MASIHKEIAVDAPAAHVWSAIRELGSVHTRLARGFVLDTRLEGDSRLVTFANGITVRERIIDVDDRRSRIVWVADLLPHDLAPTVDAMMEGGCAAIKQTLEQTASDQTRLPARG